MYRFSCCVACGALAAAIAMVGCDSSSKPKGGQSEPHHEGDGHDHSSDQHSHTGPHGGHLIELGSDEAAHAEILHDDQAQLVTVYLLDGKAKESLPITQPQLAINMISGGTAKQFKLSAVPQPNDTRDESSCFQLASEELCKALDATDAKGRLAVSIKGKQYVGEIEHHDHDREQHGGTVRK